MSGFINRAGSEAVGMSRKVSDAYLPKYLLQAVTDTAALGIGAVAAVTIDAASAYGDLFAVVLMLWLADTVLGSIRGLRSGDWRASKFYDCLLRLIVIFVLPGLMYMVAATPSEILGDGSTTPTRVVTMVLSVLGAHEFFSVLDNASQIHPGIEKLRGTLVSWVPKDGVSSTIKRRRGEAMVFLPDDEENDDEKA